MFKLIKLIICLPFISRSKYDDLYKDYQKQKELRISAKKANMELETENYMLKKQLIRIRSQNDNLIKKYGK